MTRTRDLREKEDNDAKPIKIANTTGADRRTHTAVNRWKVVRSRGCDGSGGCDSEGEEEECDNHE